MSKDQTQQPQVADDELDEILQGLYAQAAEANGNEEYKTSNRLTIDEAKQAITRLIEREKLRARIDEQERTFRLKYRSGDKELQFAQHDGSTNISQTQRLNKLEAQLAQLEKEQGDER